MLGADPLNFGSSSVEGLFPLLTPSPRRIRRYQVEHINSSSWPWIASLLSKSPDDMRTLFSFWHCLAYLALIIWLSTRFVSLCRTWNPSSEIISRHGRGWFFLSSDQSRKLHRSGSIGDAPDVFVDPDESAVYVSWRGGTDEIESWILQSRREGDPESWLDLVRLPKHGRETKIPIPKFRGETIRVVGLDMDWKVAACSRAVSKYVKTDRRLPS